MLTTPTLVIIDMQNYFLKMMTEYPSTNQWLKNQKERKSILIKNCCALVEHAKANGWGIVTVEYGEIDAPWRDAVTTYAIRKLTKGYSNHTVTNKYCDGGGEEVMSVIKDRGFSRKLYVCGVNTAACVRETCNEIAPRVGKSGFVRIVQAATLNVYDRMPPEDCITSRVDRFSKKVDLDYELQEEAGCHAAPIFV